MVLVLFLIIFCTPIVRSLLISNEFVAQALHNWKAAASFAKPAFESTITVGDSLVDTKITAYLRQWLGTNNRVGEALKGGQVLVNARTVYSNYVLKMGDLIQFRLTDAKRGEEADTDEKLVGRLTSFVNILLNPDQNPGLQILYEDDDVAVVLKPSGVHALAWTGTMKKNSFALDAVLPIILTPPDSGSESYAESLTRPLPCHRLDARVAGCLLIGKTVSALSSLNRQFENRTIAKEYTAVVCGNVTSALGGQSEAVIEAEVNGAAAQSVFTVKEVVSCNVYGSMSRLTLNPHSGRRHQLRQHCAWLGCPIVGDDAYHNAASYPTCSQRADMIRIAEKGDSVELHPGFPAVRERGGLFLMSTAIEFDHPKTLRRVRVECSHSPKFTNIVERAQKGAEWKVLQSSISATSTVVGRPLRDS